MQSTTRTMSGLKMQRRHFQLIAETLLSERPVFTTRNEWEQGAHDEWSTIVLHFAGVLAKSNDGFDRARFLAACGME
jgi:hypothetical protein